jgi:hypothetical protein
MKKLLIATTTLGLTATLLLAQGGTFKIHTQPALPSGEALERMGLTLAWRTRLLLSGNRDGIATIQLLPWTEHPQLFVQTFSGVPYSTSSTVPTASIGCIRWTASPD